MNYREAITKRSDFDYMHRKQSGGQGQFGRVRPLPAHCCALLVRPGAPVHCVLTCSRIYLATASAISAATLTVFCLLQLCSRDLGGRQIPLSKLSVC